MSADPSSFAEKKLKSTRSAFDNSPSASQDTNYYSAKTVKELKEQYEKYGSSVKKEKINEINEAKNALFALSFFGEVTQNGTTQWDDNFTLGGQLAIQATPEQRGALQNDITDEDLQLIPVAESQPITVRDTKESKNLLRILLASSESDKHLESFMNIIREPISHVDESKAKAYALQAGLLKGNTDYDKSDYWKKTTSNPEKRDKLKRKAIDQGISSLATGYFLSKENTKDNLITHKPQPS